MRPLPRRDSIELQKSRLGSRREHNRPGMIITPLRGLISRAEISRGGRTSENLTSRRTVQSPPSWPVREGELPTWIRTSRPNLCEGGVRIASTSACGPELEELQLGSVVTAAQ